MRELALDDPRMIEREHAEDALMDPAKRPPGRRGSGSCSPRLR
jgi:hypothetical protein